MYLVRYDRGLKVEYKRPEKVGIRRDGRWSINDVFVWKIGEACHEGWVGTIGVFDISQPRQLRALLVEVRNQERIIVEKVLRSKIEETFGSRTVCGAKLRRRCQENGLRSKTSIPHPQKHFLGVRDAIIDTLLYGPDQFNSQE